MNSSLLGAASLGLLGILSSVTFASAAPINLDFEDGFGSGLGHGPVVVGGYNIEGFGITFSNASYALAPSGSAPYILALGQVVISPYVPKTSGFGYRPITVDFDFAATNVSISIAVSGLASIVNTLSAYGPADELIDSDSITGIIGAGPYTLSVDGGDIRRVIIDGQLWNDQFNGFFSEFDNLSVTPAPLPATLPLFASGLAGLGWLSRRRRRRAA